MAGYGFGFGTRSSSRRWHTFTPATGDPQLSPSEQWSGQAGTGFAAAPVDPVRTTAKPAMHLIVPPRQAFTENLLVGVYAGANDRGSLYDTMGLQRVVAHYEGSSQVIAAPGFRTFDDANGNAVTYFGWWATLRNDGRTGLANLYFEAVPRDTQMQNRIIGPFVFLPSASQYDHDLELAPSKPEIFGTRYASFKNALAYLRSVGAQHPRILVTEPFTGAMDSPTSPYSGAEGYCTIQATHPVIFAHTAATKGDMRPKYDRIRFCGENIVFDLRYISRYRPYAIGGPQFDGVRFTNSAGRTELWNKGTRPVSHTASSEKGTSPWFTECAFDNTLDSAMQQSFVRGCSFTSVAGDLASGCRLLLGCTIEDMDSSGWREEHDAMTVQYTGSGAVATLSLSNYADAASRTFTAKVDGAAVGQFTVSSASADFEGPNYDVSDVVAWINGLAGWNATLVSDARRATALGLPGSTGAAFADADMKSAPVTLVTQFDLHPDIMQRFNNDENVIVADNRGWGLQAQEIFLNLYTLKDMLVVNNAFSEKADGPAGYISQLSSPHSHVVVAHNTLANQHLWLRFAGDYSADRYCMVANNVVKGLSDDDGPSSGLLKGNHVQYGESAAGDDTTSGGDFETLFVEASNGDFTPVDAGERARPVPVLRYDLARKLRGGTAVAGALA